MNTPKKPGTDLAALKARLAKKTKDGEEPAAPAAAPVESVPPPGEMAPPASFAPEPTPHYEPAPAPFADVPPPGQVAAPVAAPVHAPTPSYSPPVSAPASDDPFGGGPVNTNYDPSPSFADTGGDVPSRSNIGVVLFAGLIFLGVGLAGGFIGSKILNGNERKAQAKDKGETMIAEVQKVADTRKQVALSLQGISETVVKDPKAGSDAIVALLGETFDKHPRIDNLFGWQLGAIHANGIKKTFELYEASTRLQSDLRALAGFLAENAAALTPAGGPVSFGVMFTADGAQLVEMVAPMCGESLADMAALKACEDPTKAIAFKIRVGLGGEEKTVAKGGGADQVQWLKPEGQVYNYAIGLEPKENANRVRAALISRVGETLAEMAKSETTALKALSNYSDNPDLDGSNPQPDPAG